MTLKLNHILALTVLLASSLFGQQNTLTSTTISSAITATQQVITVASATNITVTPATAIYIDKELMYVLSVSSTRITVARGQNGTAAVGHASGSYVLAGRPDMFATSNPTGACTTASVYVTPVVNVLTGHQFLCSSVTLSWVPGFNNPEPAQATATVASAAGAITPSGPLFSVSGALAVTGFTFPVGFTGKGGFCVVPTGAFTWTTAGNINTAGTAVVGRTLCFTWSATASKWIASYL